MSFIDWNAGAEAGQSALDQQQYAQNQLQQTQQLRGLSALQGFDINNPETINRAINGSIHAGLLEQASNALGLSWMAYTQGARRSALAGLLGGDQSSNQAPQTQPTGDQGQPWSPTPQEQAKYGEISQDLQTASGIKDPMAQQAMLSSLRQKYTEQGIPASIVDEALDPSKLGEHQQYFNSLANYKPGDPIPQHPTNNAASMAHLGGNTDVLADPNVRRNLLGLGILTGDPTEMVKALQSGLYTGAAAPGQAVFNAGQYQGTVPYAPENVAPGGRVINPNTGQVIGGAPFASTMTGVAPGSRPVGFNPNTGQAWDAGAAPPPGAPGGAPTGPQGAALGQPQAAYGGLPAGISSGLVANGKLDPYAFFNKFEVPYIEGGYNPHDINGSPVNFGMNQAANPELGNVKDLTQARAAQQFAKKYFPSSANLPPALAAVNADTAMLNPAKAAQFLQQSGGDWRKYMQLRENWLSHLARTSPAWTTRNARLIGLATELSSNAPPQGGSATAPAGAPAAATNAPSPAPTPAPAPAPRAIPYVPTPQGAQQAATALAPKYAPASAGRATGPLSGYQNQDIPPDQAIAMGLAPGRWQRTPTGEIKQASQPPEADVKRVGDMGTGLESLQALAQNQSAFLKLNDQRSTGLAYANPEIGGIGLNPIPGIAERTDPILGRMKGMSEAQTLMVKPSGVGRILQSEIPIWSGQVQTIDQQGTVNQARYEETQRQVQYMGAKHSFYQAWLYQNGNLNGADEAFNGWWSKANPAGGAGQSAPAAPKGRLSPAEAANLPSGTHFIGMDGIERVRH